MSLVLDSDVTIPTVAPTISLLSGLQQITKIPSSTFIDSSNSGTNESVMLSLGNDTLTANSTSTSTRSQSTYDSLANHGAQVPASKNSLVVCAMLLFSMLSWL